MVDLKRAPVGTPSFARFDSVCPECRRVIQRGSSIMTSSIRCTRIEEGGKKNLHPECYEYLKKEFYS